LRKKKDSLLTRSKELEGEMSVDSQTRDNAQHKGNKTPKTMVDTTEQLANGTIEQMNGTKHNRKKFDINHSENATPPRNRRSALKYPRKFYSPTLTKSPPDFNTSHSPQSVHYSITNNRRQPTYQQPFEENCAYRQQYYANASPSIQPPSPKGTRFALVCFGRGRKQFVYNSFDMDESNIYRFFKATTPHLVCDAVTKKPDDSNNVKPQVNFSCDGTDHKQEPQQVDYGNQNGTYSCHCGDVSPPNYKCVDDTRVRYKLKHLWEFYDEPYGLEIPIMIRGEIQNVYFVPHLSALQLYEQGKETAIFEFYETLTPDLRCPLIDKIEELSRQFSALLTGDSSQFDHPSWYSIAWYPILCHNETMNWLKGQIITYHHFEPSTKLIDNTHYFNGVQRTQSMDEALASCNSTEIKADKGRYYVPVIGFLPYKVRNETWFLTSNGSLSRYDSFESDNIVEDDLDVSGNYFNGNRCMQAPLYLVRACKNMLYEMQIHHPDFHHVIQNFRELAQV
jgi:hypothetical protein